MIVLHAGYERESLFLWTEDFDAGRKTLLAIASELSIKGTAKKVHVWLPSNEDGPITSAALLEGASDADRLAKTPVYALPLSVAQSLHLLAACAGKHLLRPGLIIGADLAYWAAALRYAAGLVVRGQFLPGLRANATQAKACWQPAILGPEIARVHALAAAMPPVARALTSQSAPERLLREFIGSAVDALLREPVQVCNTASMDSLHDQWLDALTSKDGTVHAGAAELAALSSQIEQWQRPIRIEANAPFRLCFRLEEPEADAASWTIRYLLQATRDPSLLLPASQAWDMKPRTASSLGADARTVREHLLSSLGQASGIYPPIEHSLRERTPEVCAIDVAGAHGFLHETAGSLEQSGFGVMLPAWWTRGKSQARLKARAHVKSPTLKGGEGITLDALVRFDWKLALGDQEISATELAALAKLKAPLVKLRGQWVEVDAAEIQRAIEFLKKKPAGAATVGEIVRMALGTDGPSLPIEVGGVTATGWIAELLAQLDGTAPFEEFEQPAELRGVLRPYQRRGYSWMRFLKQWGLGACLADDMGLGKTIQALALITHEYRESGGKPILLVCPTSVVGNWQKEAAKFAPDLPVLVHHGTTRHKGDAFAHEASRHAIVLSSYALLHRDSEALQSVPWGGVILDEAQNIKNPETKQSRAARALGSGWRVALTGTPVENNTGDLWSLMEFLNPGLLGLQSTFKKKFFMPIQVYRDQEAAASLRRITGPFILRRLKTDRSIITDLPDKLEMKVFCTLTKEQGSLYAAVVKEAERAINDAEGIERKGLVLATLSKLKQVCNHPAQFLKDNSAISGRSGKLARLTEMMEETLEAGDRSLIFTQFVEMGDLIRRHLQDSFGREVMFLHGGSTKAQRDRMVERFGEENGPPIFLLSLKAGGTGLNLTRANHVFHFDRWWNPAVENQATDRAFRIGQTRNVQVHKFVCTGTLEEKIDEMIEKKKDIAGSVVGSGEGWLTEFSNAELKSLFALRAEAIGE